MSGSVNIDSGARCTCTGAQSITLGPDITIYSGSVVTLKAPRIATGDNVNIRSGAEVKFRHS